MPSNRKIKDLKKNFYIAFSLWGLLTSCDVAKEDTVPIVEVIEENPTADFHTTIDAALSINPTSFQKLKDIKSFTINQLPKHGEARFIENGFVYYKSNGSGNNDNFTLQGQTPTGTTVTEDVKINIVSDISGLPCNAGCIGDNAKTEVNKNIEIDVLKNDKTCSQIAPNSLKVEINPKNGSVEIQNQKLIYKPNPDFIGEDLFFYRIGVNNSKNPVAPVTVVVGETSECTQGMTDDFINLLAYTPTTDLKIDVLENDRICSLYRNATLKINKNPQIGTVKIIKEANKEFIIYNSPRVFKGSDNFEYALYRTEKIFIKAQVTITIN